MDTISNSGNRMLREETEGLGETECSVNIVGLEETEGCNEHRMQNGHQRLSEQRQLAL